MLGKLVSAECHLSVGKVQCIHCGEMIKPGQGQWFIWYKRLDRGEPSNRLRGVGYYCAECVPNTADLIYVPPAKAA